MPVVRLTDGCVKRFVVDVEDSRPSRRTQLESGDEPWDQKLLDKVMDLLPVGDAGERGVLAPDEHPGVQHDGNQETRLTFSKTERFDGSSAFGREAVRLRRIR